MTTGSTGGVGAIAWEDVHTAAVAIRALNFEPTAYISHPMIAGDLDICVGRPLLRAKRSR